jgi:hypothetical protein
MDLIQPPTFGFCTRLGSSKGGGSRAMSGKIKIAVWLNFFSDKVGLAWQNSDNYLACWLNALGVGLPWATFQKGCDNAWAEIAGGIPGQSHRRNGH